MEANRVEEEEECFDSIDKLISQGINAGDVKKLQDAGIYTWNGLMMHTEKSLTGIKGLSEAKVDKICEAAEKLLSQCFMTGSDLLIKLLEADRVEEEEECFDSIDKLISQGINAGDVKKLQDAGIYTCNGLMLHTKKNLTGIKGLSEAKVDKICEAAEKLLRKFTVPITTGSQAPDDLLGEAIERPCYTEAFGEVRCTSRMVRSKQYDEDVQVQHKQAYRVEEDCLQSLDKLISRSIRAGDVKKLRAAGIHTCNDLSTCSKKKLGEIKGFSEAKIDIILSASKKLVMDEYDKGSDLLINGNSVKWIRTAKEAFEEPLCGNLENPTIHSLDKFRSEKTLLTHSLCVTSQMEMQAHEVKSKVVYIDTLGLFNPNSIVSIAENLGIDGASVLENVVHAPADSFEKIEQLTTSLAAKISEEPVRLLIIDSLTPLLSTAEGSIENPDYQKKLKHLLSHLANIASESKIAVYFTKRDQNEMKLMDFKSIQASQIENICDKDKESTIRVSVSTVTGILCLNVKRSDTVGFLIKAVEKEGEFPVGSHYLTYRGRPLKPQMQLWECEMVANSRFEANARLHGGAPEKMLTQTLSEFVAKENDIKEAVSHGMKIKRNKMAKEIVMPYPKGRKGYRYVIRVSTTPLANSIFAGMLNKMKKAHVEGKSWGGIIDGSTFNVTEGKVEIAVQPQYTLDEVNAKEDYQKLSDLFWEYAELDGHRPIYLSSLCSYMDTVTKALAQDKKFHLFLRIHPCLLTYSQRSSLFWEIGREFDSFSPSEKVDFNNAVDSIPFPTDWTRLAVGEKIFYMTYVRRTYSNSSSDCFRFLRNWLTHGVQNFTLVDRRTVSTQAMDYLIQYYFKDFFADVLYLLSRENFEGLNDWFHDLIGGDI